MASFEWYIYPKRGEGGRGRYPAGSTLGKPGTFYSLGDSTQLIADLKVKNAQRARELQAEVLDNMEHSILRRNVSSRRLRHVTADPRNRGSDEFGYEVGRIGFLDNSIAKYWRQIEEGYTGHVGRELRGLWGGTIGRVTADRVYAGKPYYPHKASRRSDMFIPTGGRIRLRRGGDYISRDDMLEDGGNKQNFVGTAVIREPILAHEDYANAYRSYRPGQKSLDDIAHLVREASRKAWMYER